MFFRTRQERSYFDGGFISNVFGVWEVGIWRSAQERRAFVALMRV